MVGLAFSRSHDWQHHRGFPDRTEDRTQPLGLPPEEVVYLLARLEFHDSGDLQILRLLRGLLPGHPRKTWNSQYPAAPDSHHPSARHFVLHVSGSRLYRGRLQREDRSFQVFLRLWSLHQSVPSLDCRSDTKAGASASAGPEGAHFRRGSIFRWHDADFLRSHPQVCGRGQLCGSGKCSLWRAIRPLKLLACTSRNLRVHLASLRRFQRLQRYRPRQRATVGLPLYGEFPPALPRRSSSGFLAALAHQLEHLASRLLVHSPRRKCWRPMENHPKSLRYHGSRGSVAWRKLDVCHLWRHPRCGVDCGALLFPGQGEVSECYSPRSFHRFLLPLGSTNSYLQCSRLEPRVLPGDLTHFSGATIGGIVPFRLAE